MRKYCFLIIQICAALLVSSCGEYIDLEHLRPNPKIVINSFPETGEPVTAKISRTWFYPDGEPNVAEIDFEVNLYVNGEWYETLRWNEEEKILKQKTYSGTYIPVTNDELRITVTAPGFEKAEGTTRIPESPLLQEFNCKSSCDTMITQWDTIYIRSVPEFTFTFRDNHAETENFYLFRIEKLTTWEDIGKIWRPFILNFMPDPIFNSQLSAFDKIIGYDWIEAVDRPFSDEMFRGSEYTMTLKPAYETMGEKSRIRFSHISTEYYRYRYTLLLRENNFNADLINAGMGEPIRVYSNIVGGLGIVAGCNTVILTD